MKYEVRKGDVLETCKTIDDQAFDAVFCDPPYGLNFMGEKWDKGVPSAAVWAEILRCMKPGAHLLAFGGTRTYHRLGVNVEDGGFEIRDMLAWLYGTGFPKGYKMGRTGLGGDWPDYRTTLSEAIEPAVLACVPREGSYANNAAKYGVGGLNVEACRVACEGERANIEHPKEQTQHDTYGVRAARSEAGGTTTQDRFPTNVVADEFVRDRMAPDAHDKNGNFYFYCPKSPKSEKDAGLETKNNHPCVKPLDLCQYFSTLILPPKRETPRRILVPFSGSGSEMIGALQAGWDEVVGIELEDEYIDIANQRLAYWAEQL